MSGAPNDAFMGGLFRTASACNIARRYKARQRLSRKSIAPKPRKERKPRKPLASPKRDEVAELLSLGLEFDQIAERVGISLKATRRHFENIRAKLGPQAC